MEGTIGVLMRIDTSEFDKAFSAYKANPTELKAKQNLLRAIYTISQICLSENKKASELAPSSDNPADRKCDSFSATINSSSVFTTNKVFTEAQKEQFRSFARILIQELGLFLSEENKSFTGGVFIKELHLHLYGVVPHQSDKTLFEYLKKYLSNGSQQLAFKNFAFFMRSFTAFWREIMGGEELPSSHNTAYNTASGLKLNLLKPLCYELLNLKEIRKLESKKFKIHVSISALFFLIAMVSIIFLIATAAPAVGSGFAAAFGVKLVLGTTLQLWLPIVAFLGGVLSNLFFGTVFASSANKSQNTIDALEFIAKSLCTPVASKEVPKISPAATPQPSMPATAAAPGGPAVLTTESLVTVPAPAP